MSESEKCSVESLAERVATELKLKTAMGRVYLAEILQQAVLFDRKQQDYGSGNIGRFGECGVLVRANDKVERLRNLLWVRQGATPCHEAILDTWQDLHVYGAIGSLCHQNKWQ